MTCSACGEKPKKKANSFTKAVIEVNNPETLVLFRKVIIPVSMGDETTTPPAIGKYHNVLLVYEANNNAYLYSSDGIPTKLTSNVAEELARRINTVAGNLATETLERKEADTALGNRLTTVEGVAGTALQPSAINKVVMTDIALNANTSTTTVQIDGAKENLLTGVQTTKNLPLPVASTTQAGIMNSSTFDAITNNTSDISALMNGAVAITGLSASPSQADLTTAWETETGLTTLMNRAGVYDVTNDKVWTYYTNSNTWYAASNSTQVTINTFTNSSEGTIKGSTNVGQIFAENDGTGSVNGWDSLSNSVSTNTGNITSLQTNKQDKLTAGTNITISDNTISATGVNDPDYVHTDNNFTDALKTKLEGLENYEARGYGLTEFRCYVDATNGDDSNDGLTTSSAMKTLKAVILRYANKEHKYEMKIGLASNNTYTLEGYILNGVSIHFETFGPTNANTTINITTLGSDYSFAFYNSHVNFVGSSTRPIIVNMVNTSTADSIFYLDSGNMQSLYTTFNCGVTLWSASARFQHCTLNRKLRVNYCSVQLQESTVSSIECAAGQIDAWKTTINTNKADDTDGYYWSFKGSMLSLYGNTYVNIDTTPTVSNFFNSNGSTIYIGAVLNKNNSSTKKFSGTNTIYGSVISSLQNRYDSLKAMATSSDISADVIKSRGLTL